MNPGASRKKSILAVEMMIWMKLIWNPLTLSKLTDGPCRKFIMIENITNIIR